MNPLYNTNDSPNGSTQPTKAVNRQGVNVARSYNQFDLSYHNFKTQHFGLYEPFFVMHGVEKDKLPLHSLHEIRTLPMQSPIMSPLQMSKDFFMVPMQAILPKTWELIYRNPSQGSDVPDDANCVVRANTVYSFLDFLLNYIEGFDPESNKFSEIAQYLLTCELFFSTGSLLYNLGFKLNPLFSCSAVDSGKTRISYDTYFDLVFTYLFDQMRDSKKYLVMQISGSFGENVYVLDESHSFPSDMESSRTFFVTRSQVLDLMREKWFDIRFHEDPKIPAGLDQYLPVIYKENIDLDSEAKPLPFNIDSVLAYQVICSQYYVNPQVDFIYNCEIFRENFNSLFVDAFGSKSWYNTEFLYFDYNGNRLSYDYFSGHYLSKILDANEHTWSIGLQHQNYPYAILSYLFGYRNSLRFGDYFIDSRTRPYAVGTMDAAVVDNKVSAIDITKNITMQRYLNAVIKLGNNFGDYLRGIFGTTPAPDYHFPKFISSFKTDVSGFETASTVAATDGSDTIAQGTMVSQLKSNQDVYAYEIEIDMPCIIMGISYFVMPRVYCRTRDRFFFHRDRFDMFNPFLQYIGDQPILGAEKGTLYNYSAAPTFGYQSRYAEYKQRYSVASGGFVEGLPSWAFIVDSPIKPSLYLDSDLNQSPDFIRCRTFEFDRFFQSLTGLSLGHRWHFIVHYNNEVKALRAMEVNPNIL